MKIVIANEGQNFGTGYILAEGAVTWEHQTIPLYWNGDYARGPIGKVTNIRREGNEIVGDVVDFELSAYLRKTDTSHNPDGVSVINTGELCSVSVVPLPSCRAL